MKIKSAIISLISTITLICLLALPQTGCQTGGGGTNPPVVIDPVKAAKIVGDAAQLGTYSAVVLNEGLKPYFVATAAAIQALIDSGDYDPDHISEVLDGLNISAEIKAKIQLGIASGLQIYRTFFSDIVNGGLDKTIYAKPILQALVNGINAGTDITATAAKYSLRR